MPATPSPTKIHEDILAEKAAKANTKAHMASLTQDSLVEKVNKTNSKAHVAALAQDGLVIGVNPARAPPAVVGAYSINEFCAWSGIGRTRTYQEISSGRLKAKKVGERTLIPVECAEAWLNALPELDTTHA